MNEVLIRSKRCLDDQKVKMKTKTAKMDPKILFRNETPIQNIVLNGIVTVI